MAAAANENARFLWSVANAWMINSDAWVRKIYAAAGRTGDPVPPTVQERFDTIDIGLEAMALTVKAQQQLIEMQQDTIARLSDLVWQGTSGPRRLPAADRVSAENLHFEYNILGEGIEEQDYYRLLSEQHTARSQYGRYTGTAAALAAMVTYKRFSMAMDAYMPTTEAAKKDFFDQCARAADYVFTQHFLVGRDAGWQPEAHANLRTMSRADRAVSAIRQALSVDEELLPNAAQVSNHHRNAPVRFQQVPRQYAECLVSVYTSYMTTLMNDRAAREQAVDNGIDAWLKRSRDIMWMFSNNSIGAATVPFQNNMRYFNALRLLPSLKYLSQWVYAATSLSLDSVVGIQQYREAFQNTVMPESKRLVDMMRVQPGVNGAVSAELAAGFERMTARTGQLFDALDTRMRQLYGKRIERYRVYQNNFEIVGGLNLPDDVTRAMQIFENGDDPAVDLASAESLDQLINSARASQARFVEETKARVQEESKKFANNFGVTVQTVSGFIMADMLRGLLVLLELMAHPERHTPIGVGDQDTTLRVMWPQDRPGDGSQWKPQGGYMAVFEHVDKGLARQFTAYSEMLNLFTDVNVGEESLGPPFRSFMALAHRVRSIADETLSRGLLRRMDQIEDAKQRDDPKKKLPLLQAEAHARLIADAVGSAMGSVWERVAFQQRQYIERNMVDTRGAEDLKRELRVLCSHLGVSVKDKSSLRDILHDVNRNIAVVMTARRVSRDTDVFLNQMIKNDGVVQDSALVVQSQLSQSMSDLMEFVRICRLVAGSSNGVSILQDLPFAEVIGVKTVPIEVMRAAIARVRLDGSIDISVRPDPVVVEAPVVVSAARPPAAAPLPVAAPRVDVVAEAEVEDQDTPRTLLAPPGDMDTPRTIARSSARIGSGAAAAVTHLVARVGRNPVAQEVYTGIFNMIANCRIRIGEITTLAGAEDFRSQDPMSILSFPRHMSMAFDSVVASVNSIDAVYRTQMNEARKLAVVCEVKEQSWWVVEGDSPNLTFGISRSTRPGTLVDAPECLGMCATVLGHVNSVIRTAFTWCSMRLQATEPALMFNRVPEHMEQLALAGYDDISREYAGVNVTATAVADASKRPVGISVEDVHRMLVGMIRVMRDFERSHGLLLTDVGATAVANAMAYIRTFPGKWSDVKLTACLRADDGFKTRFAWMISAFARRAMVVSSIHVGRVNRVSSKDLASMIEDEYTLLGRTLVKTYVPVTPDLIVSINRPVVQ